MTKRHWTFDVRKFWPVPSHPHHKPRFSCSHPDYSAAIAQDAHNRKRARENGNAELDHKLAAEYIMAAERCIYHPYHCFKSLGLSVDY